MSNWPIYYKEQLIIGNPESHVAICTLWIPKEKISIEFNKSQFNCIGNLYSREGVNFILRNVLANPSIRYIILCGKSLNKSEDALIKLFHNGIDSDHKIIGDLGVIDKQIPQKAIDLFRRKVSLVDMRSTVKATLIKSKILQLKKAPRFSNPQIFSETTKHDIESFPSEGNGFIIREPNIPEAWLKILYYVMTFGGIQKTDYGIKQKELINLMVIMDNPKGATFSSPNWMPLKKKEINQYIKDFLSKKIDADVAYNYGKRIFAFNNVDQVKTIINDLKRFRLSRRSVAVLWDPLQDSKSKDPPCINLIQVLIRNDRLFLTAYIRSNDMFRAWHLNAYALKILQSKISNELSEIALGPLITISHSAHIYEDCWNAATNLITSVPKETLFRKTFTADRRGNFVIELSEGKIVASLYTPEGTKIKNFEGNTADDIKIQIMPFLSQIDHAIYVGRELYRAEQALRTGQEFIQDKI